MIAQMQDFVAEQTAILQDQVEKIRKDSVETVRDAVVGSAENLKALKSPVRTLARSGVKITSVSQNAVASLIELQSDVLTSALSDAALRLEPKDLRMMERLVSRQTSKAGAVAAAGPSNAFGA